MFSKKSHAPKGSQKPPKAPRKEPPKTSSKDLPKLFENLEDPFTSPARVSKPSKPYKDFNLPRTSAQWVNLSNFEKTEDLTIHSILDPESGSEIRLPQFLLLRAIWPDEKSRLMDFLVKLGFKKADCEEKEKSMMQNPAWNAYIKVLQENYQNPRSRPYKSTNSFPEEVGRFEIPLQNQLEIYEDTKQGKRKDTKSGPDNIPPPRRLRARRPQAVAPPATPRRSFDLGSIDFETPGTASKPVLPRAQDEAIVNLALVAFLQAIWRLDPKLDTRWTAHRKAFKFVPAVKSGKVGKPFIAVTDGHLSFTRDELSDKSAAILEVKAANRSRRDQGKHQIDMQESAQMALWIAAEPDGHWIAPLQSAQRRNEVLGKGKGRSTNDGDDEKY